MANVTTNNYTLNPQDGWVQIASGGVAAFLRVSYFPEHVPVFLANAASVTGTGTLTFGATATATDTVTIGSEVYTFVASGATGMNVNIGASADDSAANLTAVINAQSDLVTATVSTDVVTVTSLVQGSAGNYALTTTDSDITPSDTTLTGGADLGTGFRMSCGGYHFDGAFADNLYARIQLTSNAQVKISVWQN